MIKVISGVVPSTGRKHQCISLLVLIENPEYEAISKEIRDHRKADNMQSMHFKIERLVPKNKILLTQIFDLVPFILEEIWSFQENSLLLASSILHLD